MGISPVLLFGISGGELLILLLVVLLLFGPSKIPEIARMIGRGMNEVKKVQREINTEIHRYSSDIEREAKSMDSEIKETNSDKPRHESADDKDGDEDGDKVEGKDNLPYPYSDDNVEK